MTGHMKPDSLIQRVVGEVTFLGRATLDDLEPRFPENTRDQLRDALKNASYRRLIKCVVLPKSKGRGTLPGVYSPSPPGTVRPVVQPRSERPITVRPPASAWELGHGLQIAGTWPPAGQGRRYSPLGGWTDA